MEKYNLFNSQYNFYYRCKMDNDNSCHNIAEYIEINHNIDINKLESCIQKVISQIATLSIHFKEDKGVPYQETIQQKVYFEIINLTHINITFRIQEAIKLMEGDAAQEFSLNGSPLLRFKLFLLNDNHYILYFCSHHILLDGYSVHFLLNKIAEEYCFHKDEITNVTYPKISAVLNDEYKYRKSAHYDEAKDFWLQEMQRCPSPSTLTHNTTIAKSLVRHIVTWSDLNNFFSIRTQYPSWLEKIVTTIMLYMYICSGKNEQVVGFPLLCRTNEITFQTVACKLNVVPLILSISENDTCFNLCSILKNKLGQLNKYQEFRYEDIQKLCDSENKLSIFSIIINIIPFESSIYFSQNQPSVLHNLRSGNAKDIVFNIRPNIEQQSLRLEVDADIGLYDEETIAIHCKNIYRLLTVINENDPNLTVEKLRNYLPLSFHTGKSGDEYVTDVLTFIQQTSLNSPTKIAVCTPEHKLIHLQKISYIELDEKIEYLAKKLSIYKNLGVPLLLELQKGPEAIICILTALKLNIPFITLNSDDSNYISRLKDFDNFIFITSNSSQLFGTQDFEHWYIQKNDLPNFLSHCSMFMLTRSRNSSILPKDLSYIMFTSGTTGNSKGVMCSRQSFNSFINGAKKYYSLLPDDRVLHFSPLHFDACIEEIFVTLCSGASLYIIPDGTSQDFSSFLKFCCTHKLTILDLPTAYFNELVFALNYKLTLPSSIRMLIIGGEQLSLQAKIHWFTKQSSYVKLINSYGPTEATVVSTASQITQEQQKVPIGKPFYNITTCIVGENGQIVPKGCCGELIIAGPTVCLGYWDDKQKTEDKFFTINVNGQFLSAYKTGDIVYQDHDDDLYYVGRKNREVKIAGQRVNLADIESYINKNNGVIEASVIAKMVNSELFLYAHYHSIKSQDDLIKSKLYKQLPNLQVPKIFIYHKDPLPKLSNGKVNYRLLEQLSSDKYVSNKISNMSFKAILRDYWLSVLGCTESDFFSLGGESLQAIKIINKVNSLCQIDLNIRDIFEHPSFDKFYNFILQKSSEVYGIDINQLDQHCIINNKFLDATIDFQSQTILSKKQNFNLHNQKRSYNVNKYSSQYIWLYENLTKNSPMYNIPLAWKIEGNLDPYKFISALKVLILQNHVLCSKYNLDGEKIVVDVIKPDLDFLNECIENIDHIPPSEQSILINHAIYEQAKSPFYLDKELPLRCRILKTSEINYYLLLTFHHCVVDGWAVNLIVEKLCDYYYQQNICQKEKDHVFFNFLENPFIFVEDTKTDLQFWVNELKHAPEKHSLPYDIAIPKSSHPQNILRKIIPINLVKDLQQITNKMGTSLFTLLHAAFALLIIKKSKTNDVVIGCPVANRKDHILNDKIGSFVNTVAYYFDVKPHESFKVFLKRCVEKFSSAYRHHGLPFSYLVEKLQPVRGSFHPIFQIMFVCQHRKNSELQFEESIKVQPLFRDYLPPKFDLVLEVISVTNGIHLEWKYNSKLFSTDTIKSFSNAYLILLEQIVLNIDQNINNLKIDADNDLLDIMDYSTGIIKPEFLQQTLPEKLYVSANMHAHMPAVIDNDEILTYEQLIRKASVLALWLSKHTNKDDIITISFPRGIIQILAVLGVVLAGRAYLPLSIGLPIKRQTNIILHAGSKLILCNKLSSLSNINKHINIKILDEKFFSAYPLTPFFSRDVKPQDLAYIIYTSGTTGEPKGVAIEQASVMNTLLAMNELFDISSKDRILAISDLGFDLSVYDLLGGWLAGASVVCIPESGNRDPSLWLKLTLEKSITIWNSVPAILQLLINYCAQQNILNIPTIKHIWLSGDWISPKLVSQANQLFPNASITSLGGATEGTIWSVYHEINDNINYRQAIPYGTALPNQSMWILNDELKICKYGEIGDIYIGGIGVARGYWLNDKISANSFIFHSVYGGKIYKTGDRGRWNCSGYIEFLGRKDNQVKIQGFRVELGEVESLLKSNKFIKNALVQSCSNGETLHLEAWVTLTDEGYTNIDVCESELHALVALSLPAYMRPTSYHFISEFPLSYNGKVDRSQLIAIDTINSKLTSDIKIAEPQELTALRMILAETLNTFPWKIDINKSFFNNGGSSLSGIILLRKIDDIFGVTLSLIEILDAFCIKDILQLIFRKVSTPIMLSKLSGKLKNNKLPNLYLVHAAGGYVYHYNTLIEKLLPYANVFMISSPLLTKLGNEVTLEQLAKSHINLLLQNNFSEPSAIIGWSLGGTLALHMADLAKEHGINFSHVGIIDTTLPSVRSQKTVDTLAKECFRNLFHFLGIKNQLIDNNDRGSSEIDFEMNIKKLYQLNIDLLSKKFNEEQAITFCQTIKQSRYLIDNKKLPIIDTPISFWTTNKKAIEDCNLKNQWEKMSTKKVSLSYIDANHYTILSSENLAEEITKILTNL